MREIKFRAWDDVREKIYFWDETGLGQAKPHWINKKTIIMQFIGLKDKKGKEIYEGDILRVKLDGGFENFGVVWQQDKMRFGLRDVRKLDLFDSWAFTPKNDFQVIGNIYENPELLEVEK